MNNEYTNEEVEIDLSELFKAIWNNLLKIILVTFVCGAACFGVSEFVLKKTYSSSGTITILSNGTAIDYTPYLKGNEVLSKVSKQINVDEGTLASSVSVSTDSSSSYTYNISAATNDANLSCKIVSKIISVFQSEMTDSLNLHSVTIANSPSVASSPDSPDVKKNTLLGFVGGFVVSIGVVVLRFLFDKHLKNASAAENFLGIEVLAEIPYKK